MSAIAMNFEFRISDFEFSTHPNRVEPQRHRVTEKTQSRAHRKHEDTKAQRPSTHATEKPQITQINADGLTRNSSP